MHRHTTASHGRPALAALLALGTLTGMATAARAETAHRHQVVTEEVREEVTITHRHVDTPTPPPPPDGPVLASAVVSPVLASAVVSPPVDSSSGVVAVPPPPELKQPVRQHSASSKRGRMRDLSSHASQGLARAAL